MRDRWRIITTHWLLCEKIATGTKVAHSATHGVALHWVSSGSSSFWISLALHLKQGIIDGRLFACFFGHHATASGDASKQTEASGDNAGNTAATGQRSKDNQEY